MKRSFFILICGFLLCSTTITAVAQSKKSNHYYQKLQVAEKDGKYGLLFLDKVIVPYKYDTLEPQKGKQEFFSKKDGKWGAITISIHGAYNPGIVVPSRHSKSYSFPENEEDEKSKNITISVSEIPCEFDDIENVNGRYRVSKDGLKGVYYYHGREILPCEFDDIKEENGRYRVSKDGLKGVYYYHGREILPCKFDDIKEENGRYWVSKDGLKGVYYYHGREILPCEFDDIKEENGRYWVSKDGLKGVYYYHGREILPCEFDKIELTSDNKYIAYKNGEKYIYSFSGVYFP